MSANTPDAEPEVDDTAKTYRYNLDSLEEYLATSEKVAKDGRLDEAVELMREATDRYPESPTGRYNLGVALFLRVREDKAHLELWEDLAGDEQMADEAIVALQGAIERDPAFTQAYNNLARLYALRGRSQDAVQCWEQSLAVDGTQDDVCTEMALYRSKIGPKQQDLEERELLTGKTEEPPQL